MNIKRKLFTGLLGLATLFGCFGALIFSNSNNIKAVEAAEVETYYWKAVTSVGEIIEGAPTRLGCKFNGTFYYASRMEGHGNYSDLKTDPVNLEIETQGGVDFIKTTSNSGYFQMVKISNNWQFAFKVSGTTNNYLAVADQNWWYGGNLKAFYQSQGIPDVSKYQFESGNIKFTLWSDMLALKLDNSNIYTTKFSNGQEVDKVKYIYCQAYQLMPKSLVTLDNQGATTPGTESIKADYKMNMPTITVPTKTGYTFGGYYTGTNGTGTKYYNADGSSAKTFDKTSAITLYAYWTANTYDVTYTNGGHGTAPAATSAIFGSNFTVASAITGVTGYTFSEWKDELGRQYTAGSTITWSKASNTILTAQWTADSYTVSLDAQSGTGGTSAVTATFDSAMPEITIPSKDNYIFDGYYSGLNGSGTQYYNSDGTSAHVWDMTSNTTLYANWKEDWNIIDGSKIKLSSGFYYLEEDIIFDASNREYKPDTDRNGLTIDENSIVYINVPAETTLTCIGADASEKIGGGAGIYVPESSSLYLLGNGTINAIGGDAACGSEGTNGTDGWFTGNDNNGYYGSNGGGDGGNGGGGAGAGIGTPGGNGGTGGKGGAGVSAWLDRNNYNINSNKGNDGFPGSSAEKMGSLSVDDNLSINVSGGSASKVSAKGGTSGKSLYDSMDSGAYCWTAGGSAGGGAGGNGFPAEAIGIGGPGGGGGGGGASADAVVRFAYDNVNYCTKASGGHGGKGYVNGGDGDNADSRTLYLSWSRSTTKTASESMFPGSTVKDGGNGGLFSGLSLNIFAQQFIDLTEGFCSTVDDSIKEILKESLHSLSDTDKQIFKELEPQIPYSYGDIVLEAKSRYWYMITERGYIDEKFLQLYTRDELKALMHKGSIVSLFNDGEDGTSIILVASLSILTITTISAYILFRKRKEE